MVSHFFKGTNSAVFQILHYQACDFLCNIYVYIYIYIAQGVNIYIYIYILHRELCVPQAMQIAVKTHDQVTDHMVHSYYRKTVITWQ